MCPKNTNSCSILLTDKMENVSKFITQYIDKIMIICNVTSVYLLCRWQLGERLQKLQQSLSLSLYFLCRFAGLSPYNPGRGGASHVRWLSGQQQHCWWDTSIIHHTNRIHCAAFSFLSYALFFISKAKFNYTPWSHKKMFYNAKENKCIKQTSPLMLITNHPLTLKNK